MARLGRSILVLLCVAIPSVQAIAQDDDEKGTSRGDYFPKFDDQYEEAFPGRTVVKDSKKKEKESGGFSWLPALPKPKFPSLPKPTLPKLPSWGTDTAKKPSRGDDEPSTLQKLNAGTRNALTKTKHTLMPWTVDDDEEMTARKKPPATRRTARATTSKSKAEKKSFFSSWLETREEEKPVETVNDYLALPRVPYE